MRLHNRFAVLAVALFTLVPSHAFGWPKYFGYFGSHWIGSWAASGCGESPYNGHTKVDWTLIHEPNQAQAKVSTAAACGRKAIIAVEPLFVDCVDCSAWNQAFQPGKLVLKSDAGTRAATLAAELSGLT